MVGTALLKNDGETGGGRASSPGRTTIAEAETAPSNDDSRPPLFQVVEKVNGALRSATVRASLPSIPAAVDRVLDNHADALYDFALAVTTSPAVAIDAIREAVPLAIAEHGPAVTRATLLGRVFGAAMERAEPTGGTLPAELLEAGEGTHEELRRVGQQATRALEPRHRGILDLTLRQGLHIDQLGEALGVSPGQVSTATKSALAEAEHVVGAVLLSRVARDDCPGLAAVLQVLPVDGDGALVAGEVVNHQESCPACDDRRHALVPVASLLAAVPPTPAPPELRQPGRPKLRVVAAPKAPARRLSPRRRRTARVLAASALVVLVASAAAAALRRDPDDPAPAAGNPDLSFSVTELDFHKNSNEAAFEVTNTAAGPSPYAFETDAPWLTIAAPQATLPPGGRVTLVARLDRSRAPEGQIRAEIRAVKPSGMAPLAVRAEVDRAPSVSKAELTPKSLMALPCPGSAAAQARITVVEESGIDIARLHWREPNGAERFSPLTKMEDGTYTGPLGPVPAPGEVTWWIVAVDTRGNTTVSTPTQLAVSRC